MKAHTRVAYLNVSSIKLPPLAGVPETLHMLLPTALCLLGNEAQIYTYKVNNYQRGHTIYLLTPCSRSQVNRLRLQLGLQLGNVARRNNYSLVRVCTLKMKSTPKKRAEKFRGCCLPVMTSEPSTGYSLLSL